MTNHYRPLRRPATFSALPEGIKWNYVETPAMPLFARELPGIPQSRYQFGVIATDRPLTAVECDHFDLRAISGREGGR